MSSYSSVQDDSVKRAGLLVSMFIGTVSAALWLVVLVLSSSEDSKVANVEVTIDLSKQTENVKDCVLLEENGKYYLSCKMKY